jgi:four helix bundle protein
MAEISDKGLENLLVWQKATQFALHICRTIIGQFPESEKYALSAQIRRSAQSIPANIAEGHGRYYFQESVRFAYIARGSLEETFSHLVIAHELKYITDDSFNDVYNEYAELLKMVNGYISYLKRTKIGISEPGAIYIVDRENNHE